ncbi:MAG: diguanylate cyclase, partial [Gammaproteobacteria bacterium]|nr:diguanylate cyclase [Gammaproteobacteria bacterium]
MNKSSLSIHTILSLIIGFMGLLGLIFALVSGTLHQNHAFDSQRISMKKLIEIKSDNLLDKLSDIEKELGLSLQAEERFRTAYQQRNIKQIEKILENAFHRYFTTTEQLKLEKISVLTDNFELIAQSSITGTNLNIMDIGCPQILEKAKLRKGAKRLQILTDLCSNNRHSYHTTLIPTGGLHLSGYMVITSDPTHSLIPAEKALGMPINIQSPDGENEYQSKEWPAANETQDNYITSEYILYTDDHQPALIINIADKVRPLFKNLPDIRILVMVSATLITLFFIILATYILKRTTILPLEKLAQQLRLVHKDRHNLGKSISIKGVTEIQELSNSFNLMTSELGDLYKSLEDLAYTDELTELPNRNQFQRYFLSVMEDHKRTSLPFALFIMDLDQFKTINDTLGHHIGDQLLSEVG